VSTLTLPRTGTWTVDPAHTVVGFSVRHLMAARVRGNFTALSGTISFGETPETSAVDVTIDAASITTGVADRDGHLRSPDFLDVEAHPTVTFRSSDVRPAADGYEVAGELTIRGTTRPAVLAVRYLGIVTDPWGNEKALFSASAELDREDFGLTWNQALETGGWLVGKTVEIELEVQATAA
jgi:polyisoprenoid-binding protein YceI